MPPTKKNIINNIDHFKKETWAYYGDQRLLRCTCWTHFDVSTPEIKSFVINKHLALITFAIYVIFFGSHVYFFCFFFHQVKGIRGALKGKDNSFHHPRPPHLFFPGENLAYRHEKKVKLRLLKVVNIRVEVHFANMLEVNRSEY